MNYIGPIKPRLNWLTPAILDFAKSTRGRGGKHVAAQRQALHPQATFLDGIMRAAFKFGKNRRFDAAYPLNDRVQIAWEAVLLNFAAMRSAHNESALAYTIAFRTLNKVYRDEFSSREFQQAPSLDANGNEIPVEDTGADQNIQMPDDDVAAASLSPSGSPDVWKSAEFRAFFQQLHDEMLRKLPAALDQLSSIQRQLLKFYFGLAYEKFTLAEIAARFETPISSVHRAKNDAIEKLRVLLAPSIRGKNSSRRHIYK
jgi:RNA polymerase sigma factor (sigma-70 family)